MKRIISRVESSPIMDRSEGRGHGVARPFVGLRPFTFADRAIFFGRSEQVEALDQLIVHFPLTSIIGSSGSGKSSLIRAGLLPGLRAPTKRRPAAWDWVEMSPGEEPIRRLAEALARSGQHGAAGAGDWVDEAEARADEIDSVLRDSSFGIKEALALVPTPPDGRLVILIDQFEEIFRFADLRALQTSSPVVAAEQRDEATFFVRLLLTAVNDRDFGGRIILTMRSDFIGDCARFHGLAEAVTQSQYLVPALTRDQRETAICEPVKRAGGEIEPSLVQRLLNDTDEDPDQLPVLQHVMMRCWQRALDESRDGAAPPRLTELHYSAVGGVANALSRHADEILQQLNRDTTSTGFEFLRLDAVAKRQFQSLTDTDSQGRTTRRPQKLADLVAVLTPDGAGDDTIAVAKAAARRVVLRFADQDCSFLRTTAEGDLEDESIVDIGHEALIRRWDCLGSIEKLNWVREEQEDGERYRELLGLANNNSLVSAGKLPDFEKWWAERRVNRFWPLRYTRGGIDRYNDALRVLTKSRAKILAREQEEMAAANAAKAQLAAVLGLKNLEFYGATEALLNVQYSLDKFNLRLQYARQIEAIAYAAFQRLHERRRIRVGDTPASVAFRSDGGLVMVSGGQMVTAEDPSGATVEFTSTPIQRDGTYYWLSIDADGRKVVIGGSNSVRIHDMADNSRCDTVLKDPAGQVVMGRGLFSPNGRFIVTPGFNSSPKLWSGTGDAKPGPGSAAEHRLLFDFGADRLEEHRVSVGTAAGFSTDSKYLAIGDRDGFIHLYDISVCRFDDITSKDAFRETQRIRPGARGLGEQVSSLAFHPSNSSVMVWTTQNGGGYLAQWRQGDGNSTSEPLKVQLPFVGGFYPHAVFSPDGDVVATASIDGIIQLWRWAEDPATESIRQAPAGIGLADSPTSGALGNATSREPAAADRLNPTGRSADFIDILQPRGKGVLSLAFSPIDPNLLATGSMDGTVRLWDARPALARLVSFPRRKEMAKRVRASTSDDTLATAESLSILWQPSGSKDTLVVQSKKDGTRRLLDLSAYFHLQKYLWRSAKSEFDREDVRMVAISPDERAVAFAPAEGPVYLFNLDGHEKRIVPVAALGGTSWKWRWVGFATNPDRVVGKMLSGGEYVWRYFKDERDLTAFANEVLPFQSNVSSAGRKSERVQLTSVEHSELEGKFDVTLIYQLLSDPQGSSRGMAGPASSHAEENRD